MMSNQHKQKLVWNDIKIGDDVYIISFARKANQVHIFLTNLIDLWIETLTDEIILNRCKELNPLLNVDALNCKEIVENVFNNLPKHINEASTEEIKLRAPIEGGIMKFALNLSKGSSQDFWEIITKPLCISSMEILRQHKILFDLIKRKDEEIAEYKAEGAELIRKNIETKPFKDNQLTTTISIPNIAGCTNIFQTMTIFYNELNVCDNGNLDKSKSSTTVDDHVEKTKQNNNTNGSKECINNDDSIKRKPGTSNSRSMYSCKNAAKDKVTSSNTKRTSIMHLPIKKSKKNLNDYV